MNKTKICKSLIKNNLLKENMKISATIKVNGFGISAYNSEKTGIILGISDDWLIASFGETTKPISFDSITKIEGMDFTRFAQAYRIK